MNDAIKKSEEFQIEQAMLDDKLKATDWEATNEEIMELVARESYLQWIKDNENRNNPRNTYLNLNQNQVPSSFTNTNNNNNENAATCSTWDTNQVNRHSPNRKHTRAASRRSSTSTPPPSFSNSLTTSSLSTSQSKLSNQLPKVANENNKTKKPPQSCQYFDDLNYLMQQNDRASNSNEMMTSQQQLDKNTQIAFNNADNNEYKNLLRYDDEENMSMQYQYDYDVKFSDPHMYGLPSNEWNALDDGGANNDSDILARVLAASQQEYLESLKAKRHQQQHQGGH